MFNSLLAYSKIRTFAHHYYKTKESVLIKIEREQL